MRPRNLLLLTATATTLTLTTAGTAAVYLTHTTDSPSVVPSHTRLQALRRLPLHTLNTLTAYLFQTPVPSLLRPSLYRAYCRAVGCHTSECADDLEHYGSLSAFFARSLCARCRPVDPHASLVTPCDGIVMATGCAGPFGTIAVKGVDYSIRDMLMADDRDPLTRTAVAVSSTSSAISDDDIDNDNDNNNDNDNDNDTGRVTSDTSPSSTQPPEKQQHHQQHHHQQHHHHHAHTRLYYTVIHLSMRHAHRFASPCTWTIHKSHYTHGNLLWPSHPHAHPYVENDRVSLTGVWPHGLLTLTAVGAPARACVELTFSDNNNNGNGGARNDGSREPRVVRAGETYGRRGCRVIKGGHLGGFRMGSAIVLVFEAPEHGFQFLVRPGDEVNMGQPLASCAVQHTPPRLNAEPHGLQPATGEAADTQHVRRPQSSRERFKRAW